ncbi:MAG: RNA methyltransferase [Kiritimatiellae bacterium]|nr:RNA methyltransferase [Kiritimatiellia bacterium]MBP5787036.1 RNA methyltransferase [Kiritimatiellia bacterium]MBQ9344237.1 RNA methyltransferase [Kiritimatiellia bacterium]
MNPLDNIRIVLVRPIYGGNVGSVCRAMMNMGLHDLALVDPNSSMDMEAAASMACHAGQILAGRRVYDTTAEAVADCALVAGTSNRGGLYREHSKPPRDWAPHLLAAAASAPVAILFGPEDNGLSLDDIALCTQIIKIPSSPAYSSLNLAASVMVCAYELFVAAGLYEPPEELSPEAPSAMREAMFAKWRRALLAIGFMTPETADHMMLGLRRIFSRGPLTEKDVQILLGMASQTLWASRHIPPKVLRDLPKPGTGGKTSPPATPHA